MEGFELAAGTIRGREHALSNKNNQDAYHLIAEPDLLVAVVCDGCGDPTSKFSEMGAILGSQLIAETITRTAKLGYFSNQSFWDHFVRYPVLEQLKALVYQMGSIPKEVINQNFLFTTVVALVTPEVAVFATIGDGVIIINGEEEVFGYPNNAPPYLGYGLMETNLHQGLFHFQIRKVIPTENLESFLIGSDGVGDLIKSHSKKLPGKQEEVGGISQFWIEDRYFANPDGIKQRLTLINQSAQKINWEERRVEKENGYLKDDTTLVVGRRVREEKCSTPSS